MASCLRRAQVTVNVISHWQVLEIPTHHPTFTSPSPIRLLLSTLRVGSFSTGQESGAKMRTDQGERGVETVMRQRNVEQVRSLTIQAANIDANGPVPPHSKRNGH